jgi:hypothetical protein
MITGKELKLLALNSRIHALEQVFLEIHPDKKEALESVFMREMTEAIRIDYESNTKIPIEEEGFL